MPRGKFVNHKGRNRHFTNPEELEEQRRQEEEKRKWRKNKGEDTESEEEDEEAKPSGSKKDNSESDSEDSDSESESDDDGKSKNKGVANLIEIENPNRVQKKVKKLSQLNEALANAKPELSRREREQLEKQKAAANYQKLHAAGKTDEARADLARLAIIKQQREDAAKKREQEKKVKDAATQKQKEMTQKALGKRV